MKRDVWKWQDIQNLEIDKVGYVLELVMVVVVAVAVLFGGGALLVARGHVLAGSNRIEGWPQRCLLHAARAGAGM